MRLPFSPDKTVEILTMEEVMRQHFLNVFELCKRQPNLVAKQLGLGRATVYRKMSEYGLLSRLAQKRIE